MTGQEQRKAELAKAFRDIEYKIVDVVGMARVVFRLYEVFEAELVAAQEANGYSGPQLVDHLVEWREDLEFAVRMAREQANQLRRAYEAA